MQQDRTRLGGLYIVWLSDTHFYGGRAKQFKGRWRRHLTHLERGTHPNAYMQNVFNQHGRFDTEILRVLPTIPEQIKAEGQWLKANFGTPGCLNLSRRPTNNASKPSAASRAKMSAAQKGKSKNLSDAERQRRREAVVVMQTPAARLKMRASLTGRSLSAEHRRALSKNSARKGKPIHDALRAGIVAANKRRAGETRSPDVRAKIAAKVASQVWMCNVEGATTRVPPEDLPKFLAAGWQRGRKYRPAK